MSGHGDLSLKQAQRIAVAAQGLTGQRNDAASSRQRIAQVFRGIGQTQVDSVNVVCRAHYQPLFARLGPYRTEDLDELVSTSRSGVTEYWGHEASFVRSELIGDLRRWRRGHWADQSAMFTDAQRSLLEDVRGYLREHPGSSARDISNALKVPGNTEGTHWGWNWNDTKLVTESLFWNAEILSLGRNRQFERRFALAGQVVDLEELHPAHDRHESLRRLVRAAAGSLGIASDKCIAEYYRLPLRPVRQTARELVEAGELEPVRVQGQPGHLFMPRGTPVPSRITRTVRILSPFDSMVFNRARLQSLFGFHYRIEIYVPSSKRLYGYYVFPILYGHEFVGRVDLKADRRAGVLRVQALYFEGDPSDDLLSSTHDELWRMAGWLQLERVHVGPEQVLCSPWTLAANAKPRREMSL
ncbi:winged helix DNA-binding domain-containing protein [Glutamicibacter sp. MNS18]|uniref:winged helix-turn-helix domain-containing protein n=1 Tax=Glutamicibacter sp. MNS18 TaxID=2989817 RepID=UPI002235E596|nr:crosslink repair DNA glycosylase YcaQ family protein [Glutamicibacter sp. MNS18]MCW4464396.1 winged helix DNA-binding domain-containing protein [Glutamicibacter sp. MNS18]